MDQNRSQRTLRLTRLIDATPEAIFAAWTTPEFVKAWLCPAGATVMRVELDVRVGGRFRIDMQSGDRVIEHYGEYREVIPPQKLSFTWISPNTRQRETLVTVELSPAGEKTALTLTQTALPIEAFGGHQRGWSSILAKLARFLA